MARHPRVHRPGGFYHVTLRGNHRQAIFETPDDRRLFESLLAHAASELGTRVHAYCWMTNHIHLLAEVGAEPLGELVRRVATPYARAWHKRLDTSGHLFARRHFARLIDTERDLLTVIRYTHFNPVRAGLAPCPADYPWSSHHAYLGDIDYPWLTTSYALSMLGSNEDESRDAYRRYMREAEGSVLSPPFPATSRHGRCTRGSAAAVEAPGDGVSCSPLETLVREVCRTLGISVEEVQSRNSARHLTAARVEIARRATSSGMASLGQVARVLGRTASALCQAMQRDTRGTASEKPVLHSPRRAKPKR